jgi:16S rRNA (adenine1518-N6/adenine1519-N6)-dimethyltransferase
MGQSFLTDKNTIQKIVESACIGHKDLVVEIGAGFGWMTALIAQKARRVIAIEIDSRLCRVLRDRLAEFKNIEIVEMNILQYDFTEAIKDEKQEKIRMIGNIPDHFSSPILFYLLSYRHMIEDMTIMLQKEVAGRLMAHPGTKAYGIPSIIFQMFADISQVGLVPPTCFYPVPKIHSSVIKVVFRQNPLYLVNNIEFFIYIVRLAFSKRRKTLLNNLRHPDLPLDIEKALRASGIDGKRRAETFSIEEFAALSNTIFDLKCRKCGKTLDM